MTSTTPLDRRHFLKQTILLSAGVMTLLKVEAAAKKQIVMTVKGPIDAASMGQTLVHEHILVDFIGAKDISPSRWDRKVVFQKVFPYLEEARRAGCQTLVDCTPNYLGRDPALLKGLSEKSGLNIITNTGYYGGSDHKFLPAHAFSETAQQLSRRWISEWENGIDGTSIKPGFIKISVNTTHLSDISLKLIQAAALTHLKTGLTIASHTGPSTPAFEQIESLKINRVDPSAFIWVHAQNESDNDQYVKAARQGAWVSLDGLRADNIEEYISKLLHLKQAKMLHRVLVSHDAGWYDPGKTDGGEFREYTVLFRKLIPALEQEGFVESEVIQLIQTNPINAFRIGIKKWKKKRGE